MKCKKCGYEFSDNSKFCPECGEKVNGDFNKRRKDDDDDDDEGGILGSIGDFVGKIFGK